MQAGTQSYHDKDPNIPHYRDWEENCGSQNGGVIVTSLAVSGNDQMFASVGSSNSLYPSETYQLDVTTGQSYTELEGPANVGTWPPPDQWTAECVQEMPAVQPALLGGVNNGMTNFGAKVNGGTQGVHFQWCRTYQSYTNTAIGVGSVPNATLIQLRYYTIDTGHYNYCESNEWFDSADQTYGNSSYWQDATNLDPYC